MILRRGRVSGGNHPRSGRLPRRLAAGIALLLLNPAIADARGKEPPAAAPLAVPVVVFTPPTPELLALIDAAIAERRFTSANELISRARPQSDGPELQLRTAEMILASSDLPGAANAFDALRDEPAVAARALQGLGIARLKQSNLPAAVTALDAALALDPGLARAWNARAVIADRQRDWPRADAAYARAIALQPGDASALSNRGYSLLLRGRHAEAEIDLARAVAIDPDLAAARTNLRFARAIQGRYTEAFAGSTRANLADDLNTVGFGAMARGDYATAETYFNRALSHSKQFDRTAWNNLQYLKQRTHPYPDPAAALAAAPDR